MSLTLPRIPRLKMPWRTGLLPFRGPLQAGRAIPRRAGRAGLAIAPQVFSILLFLAGTSLLFVSVIPLDGKAASDLNRWLPLSMLELSHMVGSLMGFFLLLVARGVQLRMDAAWLAATLLLSTGTFAIALQEGPPLHIFLLAGLSIALLTARKAFYRRASLWQIRLSLPWVFALLAVVGTTVWLGLFVYRHVEYRDELWWQFALHGDASRFLRMAVAINVVLLGFLVRRLLQPAPAPCTRPDVEQLDILQQKTLITDCPNGYLALLGDKQILWNPVQDAFLMYGRNRRVWLAMGDPVGNRAAQEELVWEFRERADRYHARIGFYEVSAETLPLYLDLGCTVLKIGEEARVELAGFNLATPQWAKFRHALNRARREGLSFRLLMPQEVTDGLLDDLKAISDAWLADKHAVEKGFSLGFFNREYLRRTPVALVHQQERLVGFANLWVTDGKQDVSIDLMRYQKPSPPGLMDYLFLELMQWAKAEGYRSFNLGMAPFSGLEDRRLAPLWHRAGAFFYRHGEVFYNFEGLRAYKEKFHPVWQPRYLALGPGLSIPMTLYAANRLVNKKI